MIETYPFKNTVECSRGDFGFFADGSIRGLIENISGVLRAAGHDYDPESCTVEAAIIAAALIIDTANDANGLTGRMPYNAYSFWQPLNARVLAAVMIVTTAADPEAKLSAMAETVVTLRNQGLVQFLNSAKIENQKGSLLVKGVANELRELADKHRDYVMTELRSVAWGFICGARTNPRETGSDPFGDILQKLDIE